MAINAKNIVVGGKTFVEKVRSAPQEQVIATKPSAREEIFVEEEIVTKTTSSFILQSSSKFHRDMIE